MSDVLEDPKLPQIVRVAFAATEVWGAEEQMRMLQEECAELIVKVNHFLRGRCTRTQLAEEAADVTILLTQLSVLIPKELESEMARKLERLEALIRERRAHDTHTD